MNNFRILVLSRYSNLGASSRFRMFQYIPYFQSVACSAENIGHPIEIQVQSLFGNSYLEALYKNQRRWKLVLKFYVERFLFLLKKPTADVIWIEKELFPWMPVAFEKLLLLYLGIPYVLDYDDAVFHNYDLHRHPLVRYFFSKKHPELMKNSAAVIVGNSYLAKKSWESGAKNVFEVPTVVSSTKYIAREPNNSRPVIGWIGSPSTAKYLEIVHSVLKTLSTTHEFSLHIVGAKLDWSDLTVENIQWSEEVEVDSIQNFDIGIMPLHDSPWERGKCGFKLIQYMACEKPVIASDIGCNSEIVIDKETGLLAHNEAEWLKSLKILLDNKQMRISMGQAGRKRFEKIYSLERRAGEVLDILKKAKKTRSEGQAGLK